MELHMLPQPDDTTCGPTCLHAVYQYFGLNIPLPQVIADVNFLEDGGTLGVYLGLDALRQGFDACIYSYNLRIFDLSWAGLSSEELVHKLREQLKYKSGKKFTEATFAYIDFLEEGGKLCFQDLTQELISSILAQKLPILTGLSATYLYNSKREYTNRHNQSVFDDLRGEPMGHFVVLSGMEGDHVLIADPYKDNPIRQDHYYSVDINRLLHSILLGIVTYDANLLIIHPTSTS